MEENLESLINSFFENRPAKNIYKKCLIELISERNSIISIKEYDKILIDKIDKVIESIQVYLSIASK